MILILSTEGPEPPTIYVQRWLLFLNADFLRINGQNIRQEELTFRVGSSILNILGKEIDCKDINIAWFRRWDENRGFGVQFDMEGAEEIGEQLSRYIAGEAREASSFFFNHLSEYGIKWLNDYKIANINKLYTLREANKFGISTPDTIVTSRKEDLLEFSKKHITIITKPINQTRVFSFGEYNYFYYTSIVEKNRIDALDDVFFPSLFQEAIDKEVEIRVFYLDGACHSMAIFSQGNSKTEVDFRDYDDDLPNRNVPFKLPAEEEVKIDKLMRAVGLNCGSLDIILSKENKFVLLEINPVGQFGMVSIPCNYYLEEKVAKWLIEQDTAD